MKFSTNTDHTYANLPSGKKLKLAISLIPGMRQPRLHEIQINFLFEITEWNHITSTIIFDFFNMFFYFIKPQLYSFTIYFLFMTLFK